VDYKQFSEHKNAFEKLRKKYPKIDMYNEVFYDKGHRFYFKNEIIQSYWRSIYLKNRSIHPKGIIQLNF
jgi:hypothetical protein